MNEVETREMAAIMQTKRYGKKKFITSLILFSFRYKLISPILLQVLINPFITGND